MRDPRHILFLVENLSVPLDRRVWHECTTLVGAGYEVSVICPRGKRHDLESFAQLSGVRIYRYPTPPSGQSLAGYLREYPYMLAWTLYLALRVWRRQPFDVIHACNPPDLFFLPAWPFRRRGVSFVFDQHDVNPEIMIAKRGGEVREGFPERVVRWAERRTYAAADVVISPNESYRRIALTRGRIAPEDVSVVRSAPRLEEFALGDFEPTDRRGHRYLLGYLGVMGRQDGVDVLLEATARLVERGYDVMLYMAGSGEMYGELTALAGTLGLTERVLMPGYQDPCEFTPMLRSCDVCVAPDVPGPFNDISTMNKVVEYMALGRACVSFDLPENRVTGGEAIAIAEPATPGGLADAIARLLDDDDLRDRLSAAGRRRFERELSWEHSEPPLLAAYERLGEKMSAQE